MFKKAAIAGALAASVAVAAPAQAATYVGAINLNIGNCAVTCSGFFGNGAGVPSFDDYFGVALPNSGAVASQIGEITVRGDVAFTSVFLKEVATGNIFNFSVSNTGGSGKVSTAQLLPVGPLAAGAYELYIAGTNSVAGNAYSGSITLSAVPEPATWALFILGFGAMGYAMRRRNSEGRVTKASLKFA